MIELSIDVPRSDIEDLSAMFGRYVAHYNGNITKAVEKTMVKLVVALRASTIKSKKVRKIVPYRKRFDESQGRDKFFKAHEAIQEWYKKHPTARHTGRQGDQKWLPRLKDLHGGNRFAKLAIERYTQRMGVKYQPILGATKVGEAKAIAAEKYKKQYEIKRRGLSYSSWGWIMRKLGKASPTELAEYSGAVSVSKTDQEAAGVRDFRIEAANMLNWIRKATKANVSSVTSRAATMMRKEMERAVQSSVNRAGRIEA